MYVTDVARLQLLIGQLFHNICQLSAVPEVGRLDSTLVCKSAFSSSTAR